MRLTWHPEAEAEVIAAAQFYETQVRGLGADFLDEVDATVKRIGEAPERWRMLEAGIRRCLTRRFPYGIYYRAIPGEVRILVVKHHSRHPDHGKGRS